MRQLDYPEKHHLNFAFGWLALGNVTEAKLEADQISWFNRFHPEVFPVRWRIHARSEDWEAARDMARIFTKICPNRLTGWLCLSFSLFKLKRPFDAYLQLHHQARAFPKVSAIPYFLACYSWGMGDCKGAGEWLARYKQAGGGKRIRSRILDHLEIVLHSDVLASDVPAPGESEGDVKIPSS